MEPAVYVLIITFAIFLVTNVPIAVGIAVAAFFTIMTVGNIPTETIIAQRMASGIDSFALLAIPFFVLSGILMGRGGIARRLINFAGTLVGRFTGGLAYVNVLTCMLFGAISGSSIAALSSVGGFMIPEMNEKGYDKRFNVAVTTTAATTGLLIPPSNIMIVYALASGGLSIAALFVAGVLPGILCGLFIMLACGIISNKRKYGAGRKASFMEMIRAGREAFLSLMLVVVVLAGILGGIFTATEAAAIAVVYAFILAVIVYREVKLGEIPGILLECGITTSIVMILIGTSAALSWILAYEGIPQSVSASLLALSDNKIVILLIINLLLLIVGTFMDMTPAVLIFTPIFLPVAHQLGIDPVHFGIIMVANLCIGLCTPPVGTCLFVGCSIGKTTIAEMIRPLMPFYLAMFAALLLTTYIPEISLFLPRLVGLVQP
jgi:tripartite ATP-independent transporter DctM subunit